MLVRFVSIILFLRILGHFLLVLSDLFFHDSDSFFILFKSLVKLHERLQSLIIGLLLVKVLDLNIKGYRANVEYAFFWVLTVLLEHVEQVSFLTDKVMKFEMIDHLLHNDTCLVIVSLSIAISPRPRIIILKTTILVTPDFSWFGLHWRETLELNAVRYRLPFKVVHRVNQWDFNPPVSTFNGFSY